MPRRQLIFNRMVEYQQTARLDRIFSALADPTRRAILQTLSQNPSTISEIAKPFPVSFNAISKHVMVLERAGLVHREIKGREHYCWIDPDPLADANRWLEHYRRFWEQSFDRLDDYLHELKKHESNKKEKKHDRKQRKT